MHLLPLWKSQLPSLTHHSWWRKWCSWKESYPLPKQLLFGFFPATSNSRWNPLDTDLYQHRITALVIAVFIETQSQNEKATELLLRWKGIANQTIGDHIIFVIIIAFRWTLFKQRWLTKLIWTFNNFSFLVNLSISLFLGSKSYYLYLNEGE